MRQTRDRADKRLTPVLLTLTAAVQPGHTHGSVGITIGPLALRVLRLAAVTVVAAFAMLRGFLGPPGHRTAVGVWSAAAVVVVAELLLSGALDMPQRVVPLVLAATGAPAYAIFSRDPRWATIRGALRALAPWLCTAAAILAAVEFTRAWLTAPDGQRMTLLHTGVQLAAVATSWFVICNPRTRPSALVLRAGVAALAMLLVAGAGATGRDGRVPVMAHAPQFAVNMAKHDDLPMTPRDPRSLPPELTS